MIALHLDLRDLNSADGIPELLRHVADRIEGGDYHPGHTRSIMEDGERVGSYRVDGENRPVPDPVAKP